jgi:hypothetical protein
VVAIDMPTITANESGSTTPSSPRGRDDDPHLAARHHAHGHHEVVR